MENNEKHTEATQSETNISSALLDTCTQELQACQVQLQEWKDKTIRLTADFENSKRCLEKDQAGFQYTVQSRMLLDVLTILDNFDRAFKTSSPDAVQEGFSLIYKDLKKLLEKYGVTEITELKHFDPTLHEAIMNVADEGKESGTIVEVLQKGYRFKDHILRPAKVSIVE